MSKPFYCWQCKYFKPDNPATLRSGRCHRFAPHSLDYYGFSGVSVETPLTTKGDLYTYDTEDTRLPVGTDGQILYADSAEPAGIKWSAPPTGTSPLMSKGDLYTHNGATDTRLAVGSDGQHLVADSSAPDGVAWDDMPAQTPLPYIAYAVDESQTNITTETWQQKLRCTFTATAGVRYRIDFYFELNAYQDEDVEAQVQINDAAVIPTIAEHHFKSSPYSSLWNCGDGGFFVTDALSGTVNVDIDFQNGYGTHTKSIRRARILVTRVDDVTSAPLAMLAALKTLEETAPDKLGAIIMAALPADVPAPTSIGKFSQIYDGGPGMWCGQFRQNTKTIPPLPPTP
jgi:hypothetical protein